MSGPRFDQTNDLVTQAVSATRQLPLPTGPSPAIVSQTLAALREATSRPKTTFLQRIYQMPWSSKASAVLAMAASMLIVYFGVSSLTGRALAFGDVVEVLNKVQSTTWKTTTEVKGIGNQTVTWTSVGMFLVPSHERTEMTTQGKQSIQIMDGEKDKLITLIPALKTAMVIDLKNLPRNHENPFGQTFQGLRASLPRPKTTKPEKSSGSMPKRSTGVLHRAFVLKWAPSR